MVSLSCLHKVLVPSQVLLSGVLAIVDTSSLQPQLSSDSTIDTIAPRWSQFGAPKPGAVVHPASERDVQTTVKWAISQNVPFLVQNGGNGWSTTFDINGDGIVINMDKLRFVTFNSGKTEVTVGGGALISDVTAAAYASQALVATGNCNCVGMLGAVLGGGIGNLMGEFGLGVDELLSIKVVNASGSAITVTSSNKGLWYALRGAGPNFGVVTSAVFRSHPVAASELQAWTGALIFRPDQLEAVVNATQNLRLSSSMALTLTLVNQVAAGSQSIIASVFYHGSADAGRTVFQPLFDIGPLAGAPALQPYTAWNSGSETACQKGGRRPTWGVGLARMDVSTWRQVYDVWTEIIKTPGAERSSILLNAYSTDKARSVADASSAVPWRHTVRFHASLTVSYTNSSLDATAKYYGQKLRALWQGTSGLKQTSVYINNAFGDESRHTIYGSALTKLSELKRQYDPQCRFKQWFSLC